MYTTKNFFSENDLDLDKLSWIMRKNLMSIFPAIAFFYVWVILWPIEKIFMLPCYLIIAWQFVADFSACVDCRDDFVGAAAVKKRGKTYEGIVDIIFTLSVLNRRGQEKIKAAARQCRRQRRLIKDIKKIFDTTP